MKKIDSLRVLLPPDDRSSDIKLGMLLDNAENMLLDYIGRDSLPIDHLQVEFFPQGFQRLEMRLSIAAVKTSSTQKHTDLRGFCVHIRIQRAFFDLPDSRNRDDENQERNDNDPSHRRPPSCSLTKKHNQSFIHCRSSRLEKKYRR